jgi:hypothetical protein
MNKNNTMNTDANNDDNAARFKEKYLPELNRHPQQQQEEEKSPSSKRRFSVPNRHRSKSRNDDSSDSDNDHSSKDDVSRTRKTFSLTNLKRSSSPSKTRNQPTTEVTMETNTLKKTRSLPSTPRGINDSLEDNELDEQSIKKSISSMLNMSSKRRDSDKRSQSKDESESSHDNMTSLQSIKKQLRRRSSSASTRYSIENEIEDINEKTDKILILCAHLVKISNTNTKKMNKHAMVNGDEERRRDGKLSFSEWCTYYCCCVCCCDGGTQSHLLVNDDDINVEHSEMGRKGDESLMTESSSNQMSSPPLSTNPTKQPYFPMRKEVEVKDDNNDYYPNDHPIHTCTIQ